MARSDSDLSSLLTIRQAIDLLDTEPVSPKVVRLPLMAARGLRLAENLLADRDYPPFDKSLMDGYAVRSADLAKTPVDLPVIGEVPAGSPAPGPIGPGQAMAVMTGAPLPVGTDAVVPVEQTQEITVAGTRGRVRISQGVATGYAIALKGHDMLAGQVVLHAGGVIDAPAVAVAASIGATQVSVFARPRVAVLGTGDELVAVDASPADWQIRGSNNLMLVSLLEKLGCDVTDLGIARDEPTAIREAIEAGLSYDALFVTGGMSMGNYDYVPSTLQDLGVELKISKVRMKPGKPFVFGVSTVRCPRFVVGSEDSERKSAPADPNTDNRIRTTDTPTTFVFGLPGNPVAAFVCTLRLASRLLSRMAGGAAQERWLSGRLEAGLPMNGPREFYQPVIRKPPAGINSAHNELPGVEVLAWKGSADVFTLARANALLVRAENDPAVPKGTMVRVLEI